MYKIHCKIDLLLDKIINNLGKFVWSEFEDTSSSMVSRDKYFVARVLCDILDKDNNFTDGNIFDNALHLEVRLRSNDLANDYPWLEVVNTKTGDKIAIGYSMLSDKFKPIADTFYELYLSQLSRHFYKNTGFLTNPKNLNEG